MKHDLTTGTWQDDTGCPILVTSYYFWCISPIQHLPHFIFWGNIHPSHQHQRSRSTHINPPRISLCHHKILDVPINPGPHRKSHLPPNTPQITFNMDTLCHSIRMQSFPLPVPAIIDVLPNPPTHTIDDVDTASYFTSQFPHNCRIKTCPFYNGGEEIFSDDSNGLDKQGTTPRHLSSSRPPINPNLLAVSYKPVAIEIRLLENGGSLRQTKDCLIFFRPKFDHAHHWSCLLLCWIPVPL